MLDQAKFNHECVQFKGAIKANVVDAMQEFITVNPVTKLWQTISMSMMLHRLFEEWFKVAKFAAIQVFGLVKDERTFSSMSFTKFKPCN